MSTTTSGRGARALLDGLIQGGEAGAGRLAALVALVAAALFLAPIYQYSGNYDEGVYWQSLRAMAAGHTLFNSIFSSQPPYFLLSIYPFYRLFGQDITAARVGLAVFGLIGVISMYWLASQLSGHRVGLAAAALLAVQPYYLQQTHTLESDGPAVAISVLAVALTVAATRSAGVSRRWLAGLSGGALAWALLIKLFAVAALAPIVLLLLAPLFHMFQTGEGGVKRPDSARLRAGARATLPDLTWFAVGLLGAALVLLAPFTGSLGDLWAQVVTFHLSTGKGLASGLTNSFSPNDIALLVTAALAPIALLLALWRRAWLLTLALAWLAASAITVLRLNPFFGHYAALITPPLALTAALAPGLLAPLRQRPGMRWSFAAAVVALLALLVGLTAADVSSTSATLSRGISSNAQSQLAALNAFTTPGEVIVSDDQYAAAEAGHSVPPELVDTSYVRVSAGYLTAEQIERIIEQDHIRVVVLATNRLATTPGFMQWLPGRFALAARAGQGGVNGDGYQIYIRISSGAAA
ncbi:MAG TPA: glycosyltransferase family 39 protein [Ktedonobacterales bacterium]